MFRTCLALPRRYSRGGLRIRSVVSLVEVPSSIRARTPRLAWDRRPPEYFTKQAEYLDPVMSIYSSQRHRPLMAEKLCKHHTNPMVHTERLAR